MTEYKNIKVTTHAPERVMEALKQDKINYIYSILKSTKPIKQENSGK